MNTLIKTKMEVSAPLKVKRRNGKHKRRVSAKERAFVQARKTERPTLARGKLVTIELICLA